jgi:hypothetical protein
MANGFMQGLRNLGGSLGDFVKGPVGRREEEMARRQEMLNPIRETVLALTGAGPQAPFAGGPASELLPIQEQLGQLGQPPANPFMDMAGGPPVPPPPGGSVTADPRAIRDLVPPPDLDPLFTTTAAKYGIPANVLRAIAGQESSFRVDAVNQPTPGDPTDPGAYGLFQFTEATAKGMGIDPMDPVQAAEATAQMIRQGLDQGKPLEQVMMEHFGGPNPALHGPNTRQYAQEIAQRFQALQTVFPEEGQARAAAPQAPGMDPQQVGAMQQQAESLRGPFGTQLEPEPQLNPAQALLQAFARDPAAFAEQFGSDQGFNMMLKAFEPQGGEAATQTRVLSGDTQMGQDLGLHPGERARVKGQITRDGTFMPMEVVAQPFGAEGAGGGGPVVSLYDLGTGQVKSRRRDDPEVDKLVQEGWVTASDGAMLERLEGMSKSDRSNLKQQQVAVMNYVQTAGDMLTHLNENPDINTFVARFASGINDIRQEVRAIAGAAGVEFDDSVFEISQYRGTFQELGIQNQRMQSLITSMAFQRAAAESGIGRITNRMVEMFIRELGGGSAHAPTLSRVIRDNVERTVRGFENSWEVHMDGQPFTGDLRTDSLPAEAFQEQFSPDREATVGEGREGVGTGVPRHEAEAALPPNHSLGRQLPNGLWEVVGPAGNVVGHIAPDD